MKWKPTLAIACAALLAPSLGHAQEEANPAVFGIYYRCDQSQESRADEIVEETIGPVLDRHLEAGDRCQPTDGGRRAERGRRPPRPLAPSAG